MSAPLEGIEAGLAHARQLLGDPRTATDVLTALRSGENSSEVAQAKTTAGAATLADVVSKMRTEQNATRDRVVEMVREHAEANSRMRAELEDIRSDAWRWRWPIAVAALMSAFALGMSAASAVALGMLLVELARH